MTKKKGVAVIGYGGMGGWHTDHIAKSDVVSLCGIYDVLEEKQELAKSRGFHAYNSEAEVLADPNVEIVVVVTPNDSHKEISIRAMEAGKNVICEKPVVMACKDLQDIFDVAKKTGKLFSVHQNRRWDVDFLAMKQLRDSGEIGEIFNVESRIHGSRGIPSDWRGEKEFGGGMMYDWGVHLIDQVLMIFAGETVTDLYCRLDYITSDFIPETECDNGFRMIIGFASGAYAHIEVGTYNFVPMPRFYMRGSKGTAIIQDWRENCQITACTAWHENDVLPVQTAAGLTKTMAPRDEVTTRSYEIERPASDVHDYYRNFCAAVDGKASSFIQHDQLMRTLRLIELSFESHAKGEVLKFEMKV